MALLVLAVLGRAELYRWLTVQLMASAAVRQATQALQETALARGRLLELVASERGDADPGAFFMLGLLSLIEPLLQLPMAAALEPLRLSEAARDALLRRQGPWADRLAFVDAIEANDAERIEALGESLGVASSWPDLVAQAWGWAATLSQAGAGGAG